MNENVDIKYVNVILNFKKKCINLKLLYAMSYMH